MFAILQCYTKVNANYWALDTKHHDAEQFGVKDNLVMRVFSKCTPNNK